FQGSEHPFRVSELTHTLAGRKQAVFEPAVKQCELDERCFNDVEKDAVGRIDFVTDQGEFVCSGTLLNDQPGDGAPFFLTAAHCLSTQTEAQTLEVWWFYQTTSCDSGVLRSDVTLSQPTGSNLLATDPVTDATLLSITGNIPSGVVFAGYDPAPQSVGTQVFGMHHPDGFVPPDIGSYLRHTNGTIELTNDSCDGNPPFNAYEVVYNQGLTEPGSSGSGIFVSEQGGNFLVGTLTCGTSPSCRASAQNLDDFHKFSDFYPQIQQFLTQGSGGGGGGGMGPVVASLTASLTGNILTLSGTATDTNAPMTSFDVNLVDQSGTTVDSTGPTAFNFGAGPTDSFTITVNNLNQFPSAVAAALVITDSSGHSNRAFVARFTQGDAAGPSLNSISYDSIDGILVIKGGVFDSAVQVEINGSIVAPPAPFKVKAAGAKVKVFGFPATLNLNSGPNRIKLIDNGLRSNFLVLTL
ncbi:MAG: trypsin-like serine peptidase, partial [Blastocatellia bacterium]